MPCHLSCWNLSERDDRLCLRLKSIESSISTAASFQYSTSRSKQPLLTDRPAQPVLSDTLSNQGTIRYASARFSRAVNLASPPLVFAWGSLRTSDLPSGFLSSYFFIPIAVTVERSLWMKPDLQAGLTAHLPCAARCSSLHPPFFESGRYLAGRDA